MRLAARLIPPSLRALLDRWLFRIGGKASRDVVLVQRRVFILPTRQGLAFGAILILMLTAAVNYSLSLAYVLTFLLAAMGLNTMVHTYRNLAQLQVAAGPAAPVFCGERARFTVEVSNSSRHDRLAIALAHGSGALTVIDVPAHTAQMAGFALEAPVRGVLRPGRLTVQTLYPLGLYRAWSYLELDLHCIVYPRPAVRSLPLPFAAATRRDGSASIGGEDDFSGLRPYHRGDSPRHVAWKATAREDTLLTKQFSGRERAECWLDWDALPAELPTEQRLSQLARWVIDAHADNLGYGLALPGLRIPVASGEAQRRRCLEALALYEIADV